MKFVSSRHPFATYPPMISETDSRCRYGNEVECRIPVTAVFARVRTVALDDLQSVRCARIVFRYGAAEQVFIVDWFSQVLQGGEG